MLDSLLRLVKYKLSLAVTVTCMSGYMLYHKKADPGFFICSFSVFLLACGMSALNQYQERRADSSMNRTKGRPIPTGSISKKISVLVSLVLITAGLAGMLYISFVTAILGVAALIMYNLLYTGLKPVTYLSILPGAIVGAIPPVIGWVSAGGNPFSAQVIFISFLIFFWQIPHFWMLVIRYRHDYDLAGYPTILDSVPEKQLLRIVFIWISLSTLMAIIWPFFGIELNRVFSYIVLCSSLLFLIVFYRTTIIKMKLDRSFIISNAFIIILYVLFAAGSLPDKV